MKKTWSDPDPIETKEWRDAFASLIKQEGKERAQFILNILLQASKEQDIKSDLGGVVTPYINSIAARDQPDYPGDLALEAKIESAIRWNAILMVLKAKEKAGGVGGHLSSFASIATLYEVGLNHFFRASNAEELGDLVFFQGHSAEGNYARAFLEGRLTENQLLHFRQEVVGDGLSSYPHPWLMPNFWQFATVSLGLGMLQGVYQARFLKYLDHRGLLAAKERKVWVFCGDGEMDEPESIAGLALAARERLDNLIFVVNCNLQRLDGLVRGNYKIVQELESLFVGAGWAVIKVLWDSHWDALFAKDNEGLLVKRLSECLDGDLQTAYVRGPAYFREFLFNTENLQALIADWSDEEIAKLHRGGHDPLKIYAAYSKASKHKNQPVVILAQTVKGYGLGTQSTEGRNVAHNQLEMSADELKAFSDRFKLLLAEEQLKDLSFQQLAKHSPEFAYLHERRQALGGYLPAREVISKTLVVPPLEVFDAILQGSHDRTMSTTMVFGRILTVLLKDKEIAKRLVPIFSDEVRTFGLETLFRQVGIYSPVGQLYIPEDKEQFLYYHEAVNGQVLEEGITEAGCMSSWLAAAVSYMTNRFPMIPFFTYYSMFGFQRIGDLIWAASDMRARGFLIGATAGRTTLEGEGLQHQDGSSLLVASTVPSCRAYDPAFGYEMAVIIQHGLYEMMAEEKDVFYYITAMNERYVQPPILKKIQKNIIKGMYLLKAEEKAQLQLLGSGAILNEVIAAADLLRDDFKIVANIWSVTSFGELAREAQAIARQNKLHPARKPKQSYLEQSLAEHQGPVIAATDYVRAYADLIRPFIARTYVTLGTDGYGRSDTRAALRHFFEVDRYNIVVDALYALAKEGIIDSALVSKAIQKYGIDPEKPNPVDI